MPIFEFRCKKCGEEFERIEKDHNVKETTCPYCHFNAFRIFPTKAPNFKLVYNPQKDITDWNGNKTRYWDDYRKMKAEGKKPRIPSLDGEGS